MEDLTLLLTSTGLLSLLLAAAGALFDPKDPS